MWAFCSGNDVCFTWLLKFETAYVKFRVNRISLRSSLSRNKVDQIKRSLRENLGRYLLAFREKRWNNINLGLYIYKANIFSIGYVPAFSKTKRYLIIEQLRFTREHLKGQHGRKGLIVTIQSYSINVEAVYLRFQNQAYQPRRRYFFKTWLF